MVGEGCRYGEVERDNSRARQQFHPFIKGATRRNTTYNKIHKASHTYINIHTFMMQFAQEMHNNTISQGFTFEAGDRSRYLLLAQINNLGRQSQSPYNVFLSGCCY